MKTATLLCDDYKVDKFKAELIKNGFDDFEVVPLSDPLAGTTNIKIKFHESQFKELKTLIHKIEISFKQSN
jgi:hypothetical protein